MVVDLMGFFYLSVIKTIIINLKITPMKHLVRLFSVLMIAFFCLPAIQTNAQAVDLPFNEDFEAYEDTQDFLDNSGWTTIDHDGDGNNWFLHYDSVDDINVMASRSWDSTALTPENYLITPQLNLPSLGEGETVMVSYHVAASGNNFYEEHYKVVISTTGNDAGDFIDDHIVFEETLTAAESGWGFASREIDISGFAGAPVYIAIVHYDCTDQDRLLINNFSVSVATEGDDLPFAENFNAYESTEDFLASSGWTTIDADGDGSNWFLNALNGENAMASYSWDGGALEPENYLITPQIQLPQETGDGHILLTYDIAATGNNFYEEHYKVVISTTGNTEGDFPDDNIVLEETLTAAESGSSFALRIINLDDFAGESVYVAFVHYDCTDQDALLLNNVAIRHINSAFVHPPEVTHNPLNPVDLSTTVHYVNASEITAIHHGADELVEGVDYTVTPGDNDTDTLTFMVDYFEGAENDIVFEITFDTGEPAMFTVVIDVVVEDATISPDFVTHFPQDPNDVSTTITWGSATAVAAIHDGDVELNPDHYVVAGDELTILAGYFADIEPGYVYFNIVFDAGNDALFVVRVFDNSVFSMPFIENFTGSDMLGEDTPEEWLPNGWRAVDANGDGHNWYWVPVMDGEQVSFGRMQSRSAVQIDGEWQALTPDNWLITPEVQLNPITEEDQSIMLSFRIAPGAATPGFKLEHYSVMISYTDLEPASFMEIFSETLSEDHPQNELQLREVELSFYEGQTVFVAFRHHDVTDMDRLLLSDVQIRMPGDDVSVTDPDALAFQVYPNPAKEVIFIESGSKIIDLSVISLSGQTVYQQNVNDMHHQLNISTLPDGLYIIKATTNQVVVTHKVRVMN